MYYWWQCNVRKLTPKYGEEGMAVVEMRYCIGGPQLVVGCFVHTN